MAWSYLLVGKSFFWKWKDCQEKKNKNLKFCRSGYLTTQACTNHGCLPCKLAGCTISITWVLSWNTPRPSIQCHYNSPTVNNHKSNEIHKPLRWCLLSLTLGSSDIHSLEVRAFRPIICSIYAIFPSFYHMNYALCHNLPEHFSSLE